MQMASKTSEGDHSRMWVRTGISLQGSDALLDKLRRIGTHLPQFVCANQTPLVWCVRSVLRSVYSRVSTHLLGIYLTDACEGNASILIQVHVARTLIKVHIAII